MRRGSALLMVLLASAAGGCYREKCDAKAIALSGSFVLATSDETGPFRRVDMRVDADSVTVEYERRDGSRWRASYRVRSKGHAFR
jgi:hypothetical protein